MRKEAGKTQKSLFGCWTKAKCKTLKDQEAGKLKHKAEEKTTSSPCIY